MFAVLRLYVPLAAALLLFGCTSIKVTAPADGTSVALPQAVVVTESVGIDGYVQGQIQLAVDGTGAERFNNVTYSVPPGSTLCCLSPGGHSVTATGKTASSGTLTSTSNFTVTSAPYFAQNACQTGAQHPFLGLCCDGGSCDRPASSNFGAWRFPTATCANNKQNGCINQNANAICGPNGVGCAGIPPMATQMIAVSFFVTQAGALKQVQVPIGWRSGTNTFQVWITTDNAGRPGTVVEAITLNGLRMQPFPVQSPAHIFSNAKPTLAAGTTYWLVIGPGGTDTVGSWNYSPDDAPAANSANFLVNTTSAAGGVPNLSGPWVPAGGPLRTAFQIDVR